MGERQSLWTTSSHFYFTRPFCKSLEHSQLPFWLLIRCALRGISLMGLSRNPDHSLMQKECGMPVPSISITGLSSSLDFQLEALASMSSSLVSFATQWSSLPKRKKSLVLWPSRLSLPTTPHSSSSHLSAVMVCISCFARCLWLGVRPQTSMDQEICEGTYRACLTPP